MAETIPSIEEELVRRHRVAATTVVVFLVLTAALVAIAYFKAESLYRPGDPSLAMALWITILILGLGSLALRRTRFQRMRLRDIAALRGVSGLLSSVQSTTIQVAFIGAAIALLGFIVTIMTGKWDHMLRAGGVAVIVLLYCYPLRSAWRKLVESIEQSGGNDDAAAKGIVV